MDSTIFWEVRKELMGRTTETAHAVEDENGELQETVEGIKRAHTQYYKSLLTTRKAETHEEEKIEEVMELIGKAMEMIAKCTPPRRTTLSDV